MHKPWRVLLTGASGFVGGHLLSILQNRPDIVVGALLRRPLGMSHAVQALRGDLLHPKSYRAQIEAFAPHTVVHVAWQGVHAAQRNSPAQHANRQATLQLFEAARRAGARRFVGLGSQAEYGPHQGRIDESAVTAPTTEYGAAELLTARDSLRWGTEHGVEVVWARLFSSYGPGDHPAWLLPYIILSLLRRETPQLTAGTQKWDYVHVRDVATALLALASHPEAAGIYNLGSGTATPIRDIVTCVRNIINPRLPLAFGALPFRPDQVMHLQADITRLQNLGWEPQIGLPAGLQETVDWYRSQLGGFAESAIS